MNTTDLSNAIKRLIWENNNTNKNLSMEKAERIHDDIFAMIGQAKEADEIKKD